MSYQLPAEPELLEYERVARAAAVGTIRGEVDALIRDATVLWTAVTAGGQQPLSPYAEQTIRGMLLQRLRYLAPLGPLRAALDLAIRVGQLWGYNSIALPAGMRIRTRVPARSPELRSAGNRAIRAIRQDLAVARQLARSAPLVTSTDLQTILAAVRKPVVRAEQTATWVANRAVAEGARHAIEKAGGQSVWVAERDACLTCLAYAGQVADPGQDFPAGLTFGDSSTVKEPIAYPPAHPNCRCRLQGWFGSEEGVGPVGLPQALRREAVRTTLSGRANASEPARVRAATRLLQTADARMVPKTVRKRAQKAVVDGRFPDRTPLAG